MNLKVYLIEQNENGDESTIKEWTVITNSVNRALQMYDNELDEGRVQWLEYKILAEDNNTKE